jgi:hypothetical protein
MYIDALTLAGFASVASFALMPLLMGREFWRVSECERAVAEHDECQGGLAPGPGTLASGCVDAA